MAASDNRIMEHFGLRRRNYILDPHNDQDGAFWGNRSQPSRTQIAEDLRIDIIGQLAPKRLFWGPYGGGKTHTLAYTSRALESMTHLVPIYVECPTMGRKSTFLDLYQFGIMKAIGQELALSVFNKVVDTSVGEGGRAEVAEKLRRKLGDAELAMAVLRFLDPQFDPLVFWSWFSGASMPRAQLQILSQTNDLTVADPSYLAGLLITLGRLYRDTHDGRMLVLILDELERLRDIGDDGRATFTTAFTRLTDENQNDLGVLMAYSIDAFDRLPDMFRGPVESRLTRSGYVEIPALAPPEAENFMKSVIGYVRDPNANLAALTARAREATAEQVVDDLFPFTQPAFEKLIAELPTDVITPREIMHRMTRAVSRAYIMNRPIVTSDLV